MRRTAERKKYGIQKIFSSLSFFFFIFLFPSIVNSEDIIEVKGVKHWSTSEYTRAVIELSGSVEISHGKLSNPERLFFDLKNAKILKDVQKNVAVNDKLLKMIRVGQFNATTVRVVFDLEVSEYEFKTLNLEDPARLVIEIFQRGGGDKKTDSKTEAAITPKTAPGIVPSIVQRRIVLDAGHGGHDPGAIGPNGLYEKDVVLDIALKARDMIKKEYPQYDVILTRDKDVFIPLEERAKIANNNNADLFVSIHANASPNKKARGMETYLLNWTDDEEAMKVAARENAISLKQMKQAKSELGFILASLERESKRDESVKVAGYIQNSLVSTIKPQYPKVNNLGVKQALFYVLVGAKMQSALVEVSFISNPEEEKLLNTDSYREKLAGSIASGIHSYFSAAAPQQTPEKRFISYSKHASDKPKIKRAKYTRRAAR
jgi:N-acetylmuramoyl-L-alanine amidase